MAVVLTLVQTKQIIYIKETIQKHSTNNTKHSKNKYTASFSQVDVYGVFSSLLMKTVGFSEASVILLSDCAATAYAVGQPASAPYQTKEALHDCFQA